MNKREKIHLQNVQKTLVFIAKKLNSLNIKWLLSASGSLMVYGIDIVPRDLDIFTSADNVRSLEKKFKQYVINPLHYYDKINQREIEFQMVVNNIEIEICELDDFGQPAFINFKDIPIPVNSLEKELEFYKQRAGKENIVRLIEKKLYNS